MFYPKWAPSPAEPAHNLQNQEIIWFLHYNVIHSPTSLSAIVQLYEYIFSSHPFPHPFFLRVLLRFFSELDKLDGFKANLVNMGSGWPFLYGFFFTKDGFNVYSYCNMYESCILFFPIVIKNK